MPRLRSAVDYPYSRARARVGGLMYLARAEFGCVARVVEVEGAEHKPRVWAFLPRHGVEGEGRISTLCRPGIAAVGHSPQAALSALRANEQLAAETIAGYLASSVDI